MTGGKFASFDFGANASITGSSAYIQDDLLAAQLGQNAETLTATNEIRRSEVITVATLTATGVKTATGTADAEVGYAYTLNTDGTINTDIAPLTQGATAASGVFSYDTSTNVYTFFTGTVDGTKFAVNFYPETSTARKVENIVTNFTKTLRIEADILFKDVCTDQLVAGQLIGYKGNISGEFEWNATEGGDPAVHNFSVDFLADCDDQLWKMITFDEADMT